MGHVRAGEPSDGSSLRIARAKHARALAYLAHSSRPNKVTARCLPSCCCAGHKWACPRLPSLIMPRNGSHSRVAMDDSGPQGLCCAGV